MKDLKPIFTELENKLKKSSWFSDSWNIYNRGLYLQLSKNNWYNEIYIEFVYFQGTVNYFF